MAPRLTSVWRLYVASVAATVLRLVVVGVLVVWAHPGVLAAPLTVTPALSVSEEYNNNLYLSRTDPVGDWLTTVAPRVDLSFDHRLIQGGARYQATAERYRQRSEEDRVSHRGELEAALNVLRRAVRGLDVRLSGTYSVAGQLPGTRLGGGRPELGDGVLLPRMETTQWHGAGLVIYSWTRRVETRAQYAQTVTRYDAVDLAALADVVTGTPALTVGTYNSTVQDATVSFRYRSSRVWTLTLNPGWRQTRIDPVGAGAERDKTTMGRLTVGAEYSPGATLTLRARGGATLIEGDRARPLADVELERSWQGGRVTLTGGQWVGEGGGVTNTVSLTQRANVNVSQSIGARTTAILRLDVARNVSLPEDPAAPTTRIMTYGVNAGAGREFLRWLVGRLDYAFFVQNAVGIPLDGRRHIVTLTLTATAPPWSFGF